MLAYLNYKFGIERPGRPWPHVIREIEIRPIDRIGNFAGENALDNGPEFRQVRQVSRVDMLGIGRRGPRELAGRENHGMNIFAPPARVIDPILDHPHNGLLAFLRFAARLAIQIEGDEGFVVEIG